MELYIEDNYDVNGDDDDDDDGDDDDPNFVHIEDDDQD